MTKFLSVDVYSTALLNASCQFAVILLARIRKDILITGTQSSQGMRLDSVVVSNQFLTPAAAPHGNERARIVRTLHSMVDYTACHTHQHVLQ